MFIRGRNLRRLGWFWCWHGVVHIRRRSFTLWRCGRGFYFLFLARIVGLLRRHKGFWQQARREEFILEVENLFGFNRWIRFDENDLFVARQGNNFLREQECARRCGLSAPGPMSEPRVAGPRRRPGVPTRRRAYPSAPASVLGTTPESDAAAHAFPRRLWSRRREND